MMDVMYLADQMNKWEDEVLALSPKRFARWMAYFQLKDEAIKRARRK